MYQGKFDKKNKKTSLDVKEARKNEPVRERIPQQEAPRKAAAKAAPAKRPAPQPVPQVQEVPERRGPRLGGVIFYTLYFLFIFLFFVGTFFLLNWLHGWLSDYEAAQPNVRCEEVFSELFADPDWGTLYDAAGLQDTKFETKDAYVAYMEAKVGDNELTYQETSAGLSGGQKYFIKLGDERLGHFTLVETPGAGETDIPDWQLGEIQLQLVRNGSYKIQMSEGCTASVNGVALDDSYTIQVSTILAQDYLPSGVTAPQTRTQQITGLLMHPEVVIKDASGNALEVTYEESTNTFIGAATAGASATISDEEKDVALNAAKTYAYRMIEEYSKGNMSTYFDTKSEWYKDIMKVSPWMQDHNGYRFLNEEVSQYCRYSDDVFSAKVNFTLNVTRTDGSTKDYTVDSTLFFQKNSKGKWLCYNMVNKDVQQPVGEVRLTFLDDSGEVISSEFYPNDSSSITAPVLSAPAGKVFTGWVREVIGANGSKTLSLVFTPDEFGKVPIAEGTVLQPMTLMPLFENPDAVSTAPAETTPAETSAATEAAETEASN